VSAKDGKIINIEGDPDHPVNRGAVCSKGAALYQVANNDRRMRDVMYRAPGSNAWQKKSWDWAIDRISQLVKETRDRELAGGRKVNRVNSIAAIGGASLDTEECYLYSKLMRALGVVYIEHQARI
jgi:formate dehydrogenase major subunit